MFRRRTATQRTMSTLHPWRRMFFAGGDRSHPVILGKGCQLTATIAYAGHDLRCASDADILMAANSLDLILAEIAGEKGYILHEDLTALPAEYLSAPWWRDPSANARGERNPSAPPMVALLEDERTARHSHLVEPVIFKSLTAQPNASQLSALQRMIEGKTSKSARLEIWRMIDEFSERVEWYRASLAARLGHATRLDADRIYSYCHYVLTGEWIDLEAPTVNGTPFGQLLSPARDDDERGNTFTIDGFNGPVHVRCVTPYGMPDATRPEYFADLATLGRGFRWVNRLILTTPEDVQRQYRDEWKRYKESTKDFRAMIKERMKGEASDEDPIQGSRARRARIDVEDSGSTPYGVYLASTVVIYQDSAAMADEAAKHVASVFRNLKKPVTIEGVGTKVAFSVACPGQVRWSASTDVLPSYPAITSLPISLPDTGPDEAGGINETPRKAFCQFSMCRVMPARVDFGSSQNRHVTVIAPVRRGKSSFLQKMNQMFLAWNENPFLFQLDVDVDRSASRAAALAMGGQVISFGRGTAAVQPLRNIEDEALFERAVDWIMSCVRAHGMDWQSPTLRSRAADAMRILAGKEPSARTLPYFHRLVQDHLIRSCVEPFALGEYAPHVGGNRNVIGEPPYVVIEVSNLKKGDAKAACVVAALINEITDRVQNHPGPVQLNIDEQHHVLPLLGDAIDAAYKRWPKSGAGITVIAHDPRDLISAGVTGEIIGQNTGAWVCLGDVAAQENPAYREFLRLSEFQVALLSEMQIGRFMIRIDRDVRVVDSDFSPLELWTLGQTGKKAQRLVDQILAEISAPEEFAIALLNKGGFHEEANRLASLVPGRAPFGVAAE